MVVSRRLEAELERLEQIRKTARSEDSQQELRLALAKSTNIVVAKAADICGENQLVDLEPELEKCWQRFLTNPLRNDKGCHAKTALARALVQLDCNSEAAFLQGIRYRQPEPVWGGSVDTAAELRGICAGGLAQLNIPEAVNELAELLADPETTARIGAARALTQLDAWRAEPLLRFKILSGDENPKVLGECCLALLQLAPQNSMSFVSHLLGVDDISTAEAAALALGESRLDEALSPLQQAWGNVLDRSFRRTVLVSIAMLHTESALEFLLQLAARESLPTAEQVVIVLAIYRHDEQLLAELMRIAAERDDDLDSIVRREFLLQR